MRYWVYINDKVIDKPFEEGELASIPGFNGNILVCKETPAEGETQEWMPAKFLIEAYKQPTPPPPPTKQVIDKFKEENLSKDSKKTILSSNIFGASNEDKDINLNEFSSFNMDNAGKTSFAKTEEFSPQEQASFEEEMFSEQPMEIVSIDDVKEEDLDNTSSEDSEKEEEILKTAIKTLKHDENEEEDTKKQKQTVQAIDIAHNKNLDIFDSDSEEDNLKLKPKSETQESLPTELTPLGESKTGINHLFDIESEDPNLKQSEKEEQKPEEKDSNNPLSEEEFLPEEEISLEDEDFLIVDQNKEKDDIINNQKEMSFQEEETLKEFAQSKEEESKINTEEEKEIAETFTTSPALIADLPQENETFEDLPEVNDLLEKKENAAEESPTTLDELTGKFPIKQDSPESEEENKEDVFIPSEVHPDIIVEKISEEPKEDTSDKIQAEPEKKEEEKLDKDNFLTTFSSDIETVFLDQPTAFISDYIPPEETSDKDAEDEQKENKDEILDIKSKQGQHQVSLQNVRRVKPAAIKTVPMVEGEQIDPFSQTQIRNIEIAEQAMAKIEHNNSVANAIKTVALIMIFLIMVLGALWIVAQFEIMPKEFSPLHAIFMKDKEKIATQLNGEKKLTPEEIALKDLKEAETLRINKIVSEVKNYKLIEGITLEEKIKLLHPTIFDTLKWEAEQLPTDLTYYSVKVSSPTNPEGYTQVNYRFNYNTVNYSVEATTSEANNVMVNPYKAPVESTSQK